MTSFLVLNWSEKWTIWKWWHEWVLFHIRTLMDLRSSSRFSGSSYKRVRLIDSCDVIHVIIINAYPKGFGVWARRFCGYWLTRTGNSLECENVPVNMGRVRLPDMEFKWIRSSGDSDRCKRMGNQYQCIF